MTPPLLIEILRTPHRAGALTSAQWDLLVRQARHANLLGHLHMLLVEAPDAPVVPAQAARHLLAGARLAQRQQLSVQHEARQLRDALGASGLRAVLLKGAAYVMSGKLAARGRVFSDIDILVSRTWLAQAEAALMLGGWASVEHDAYNQRYYREWMHELPPMQHISRGSVIDVHHTILPPTSRLHPDPGALVADAIPLPDVPGLAVLAPADMVLHSAAHLFHEGEGDNALRDLVDLRTLIVEFLAGDPDFWLTLLARARHHGLHSVLALALHYLDLVLAFKAPHAVMAEIEAHIAGGTTGALRDAMYLRILTPLHASTKDRLTPLAREALYIRAHWLRMPPVLLARHLARKMWARMRGEERATAQDDALAPQQH